MSGDPVGVHRALQCPNWPGYKCPYHASQCGSACADSWDGEHCFVRQDDGSWRWSDVQ